MQRLHQLSRSQVVARPRAEVFAFFSDAANLEALTPPFLRFRILTPMPIEMRAGARIDYSLSLFGMPVRWRTLDRIFDYRRDAIRALLEESAGTCARESEETSSPRANTR